MMNALESSSTRPYLVRALYEWCTDNGFTPYVAVSVDDSVHVPREFVKNGEIVLNVSLDATSSLKLGNEFIEFKARFAGTARDIVVPIGRVVAIYARENGQGMAFPPPVPDQPDAALKTPALSSVPEPSSSRPVPDAETAASSTSGASNREPDPSPPPAAKRPALKRIK